MTSLFPDAIPIPKPSAWAIWVDANRAVGRADPVTVGPDLSTAKRLFKALNSDVSKFRSVCDQYLKDLTPFLVNNGHSLRFMPINKYLNKAVLAQSSRLAPSSADEFAREALERAGNDDEPGILIPI